MLSSNVMCSYSLIVLLQYGQWMGQPFPARRRPVQRGGWDRRVDQGRQADHAYTRRTQPERRWCFSARELCRDSRHRHDHRHSCEPRQRQRPHQARGPRSRGAAARHRGPRRRQPSRARRLEEETQVQVLRDTVAERSRRNSLLRRAHSRDEEWAVDPDNYR